MLGHPVAPEPQRLDVAGEIEGITQRLTGIAALGHGREVEYGEWDHRQIMANEAAVRKALSRRCHVVE